MNSSASGSIGDTVTSAAAAQLLGGARSRSHRHRRRQRSELNAARTSVEKSSGSSQAAKWPPLSTSLK